MSSEVLLLRTHCRTAHLAITFHTCFIISNISFLLFQKPSPFVLEQIDFFPPRILHVYLMPRPPLMSYGVSRTSATRFRLILYCSWLQILRFSNWGAGTFLQKMAARSAGKSPSARAACSSLRIFFPQIFQHRKHLLIVQISDDVSDRS